MATEVIKISFGYPGAPIGNPNYSMRNVMPDMPEGVERDPNATVDILQAPLQGHIVSPLWMSDGAIWVIDVEEAATAGTARRVHPPVNPDDPKDVEAATLTFTDENAAYIPVPSSIVDSHTPPVPLPQELQIAGLPPLKFRRYQHVAVALWLKSDKHKPQPPLETPDPSGDELSPDPSPTTPQETPVMATSRR